MSWTSFGAADQIKPWVKRAVTIASFMLLLASARDASAACQNGAAAQTVPLMTGPALIDIITASHPPCTLSLNPGTYAAAASGPQSGYTISEGITLRAANGPGTVTLAVSPGQFSVISIWPVGGTCPSGAVVENLTLAGGAWGIYAKASTPGCPNNQISGITLRNLVISGGGGGHAINFVGVQSSVIDSVTTAGAFANGIFLEVGSNNNIVMNCNIGGTMSQMAIAVQTSNDNVIVGNTINVASAFDGIFLNSAVGLAGPGSSRNRVERNTITGHKTDGIVVNDSSHFNYVGLNTAVSKSYTPGSTTPPSIISGTGIWVNNASNGNYLFGNDVSGSPENGIDVLTSSSTYLQGNSVHGNFAGGIWLANIHDVTTNPAAPPPQDNVLHGNNIFFNTSSANIFLQGALNSEVAFNYISGAQTVNGTLASNSTTGFNLTDSATIRFFENTVSEVGARGYVFQGTTNATFFRNRFLKGTNIMSAPPAGRNGVTYSLVPADVRWDGGSFLGGNHWSDFAATGNPSVTSPYTYFVGNTNGGPYVDRFPYSSETLKTVALPNSVTVVAPVAGSVLAAGTTKTVRWVARGCSFVDLYYGSPAGSALIAASHPNTGYYFWSVPAVGLRSDYFVQVVCADSNGGSLGVSGNSPAFTIASSDLVLLNPGRGSRFANGGVVRVAWKASAAVTSVNIFVKSDSGTETNVAANVSGTTFRDITLPAGVSNSSRVTVRIQDSASGSRQDSVDGYFMVRGGTPAFATTLAGLTLQVGSIQLLGWSGTSGSYFVDLDLVGASTTSIAKNLTDFGNFTWLVPDIASSSATVRATFKDAAGNVVGTATTSAFAVSRGAGIPPPPPTNMAPTRHDFDGDGKSEIIVFRPSSGTWYVRYSSQGFNAATAATLQWGLPGDIPISADFDGDRKLDLTIFRPSNGTWYIRTSSSGYAAVSTFQWGLPGDIPIAGDFDSDGRTELTIYRPSTGTWYVRYSTQAYDAAGAIAIQWGLPGDIPVAGDFDGDGRTDLTIFRPSNGIWYIRYSSFNYSVANSAAVQWGVAGDIPVVGDFDGDGSADLTIFRPSVGGWFIRYSSTGYAASDTVQWGLAGDIPIPVDLNGDGRSEITVFRPSNGTWYDRDLGPYQWGLFGDVPVK